MSLSNFSKNINPDQASSKPRKFTSAKLRLVAPKPFPAGELAANDRCSTAESIFPSLSEKKARHTRPRPGNDLSLCMRDRCRPTADPRKPPNARDAYNTRVCVHPWRREKASLSSAYLSARMRSRPFESRQPRAFVGDPTSIPTASRRLAAGSNRERGLPGFFRCKSALGLRGNCPG